MRLNGRRTDDRYEADGLADKRFQTVDPESDLGLGHWRQHARGDNDRQLVACCLRFAARECRTGGERKETNDVDTWCRIGVIGLGTIAGCGLAIAPFQPVYDDDRPCRSRCRRSGRSALAGDSGCRRGARAERACRAEGRLAPFAAPRHAGSEQRTSEVAMSATAAGNRRIRGSRQRQGQQSRTDAAAGIEGAYSHLPGDVTPRPTSYHWEGSCALKDGLALHGLSRKRRTDRRPHHLQASPKHSRITWKRGFEWNRSNGGMNFNHGIMASRSSRPRSRDISVDSSSPKPRWIVANADGGT